MSSWLLNQEAAALAKTFVKSVCESDDRDTQRSVSASEGWLRSLERDLEIEKRKKQKPFFWESVRGRLKKFKNKNFFFLGNVAAGRKVYWHWASNKQLMIMTPMEKDRYQVGNSEIKFLLTRSILEEPFLGKYCCWETKVLAFNFQQTANDNDTNSSSIEG